MTQITPTTAAMRARAGMLAAIRAALAGEERLDIDAGWMGPPGHYDWVALGDVSVDTDPKTVGPRRSWDETISLEVNIGAWRPGTDAETTVIPAYQRADALLSKISTYVTTGDQTTLGGVVAWTLPGSASWAGAEYDGGFQIEVAATFICSHRVRAA